MNAAVSLIMFFSVLFPTKTYYAPGEPINITVKPAGEVSLFLADFTNRAIETKASFTTDVEKTIDIRPLLPEGLTGGTFILYAVPKDAARKDFAGTPLVITVFEDKRQGAPPGPVVIRVEPLCFVQMTTDKGPMTMAFYYDVAPNTVDNFLALSKGGLYDGLTFHRIVKDFVIQGGDPRGDGTGGPGYMIDEEFNDRQHQPGVLSMARSGDPNEAGGAMPRSEFANSAGSQFFICLNYDNTKQLDRRYTAFGKLVDGTDPVKAIAAVPLADEASGKPKDPPKILKSEVKPVTAKDNPYLKFLEEAQGPSLLQK
jgi:peptidyl-prolyl cis-trans isomerase B (cyclophilin B)